MQVVFAHYHLNPGGVTQVILNQIRALATLPREERPARIGVLYGGRHEGWPKQLWPDEPGIDVVLLAVPELDYDESDSPDGDRLAAKLLAELSSHGFAPAVTLLHAHNHALGKNSSWPGAVARFAENGYRMLLQVHDFAEDFRPANYRSLKQAIGSGEPGRLASDLYLQASGIHYATLTRRDAKILGEAGIDDERLHVLPNPVAEFDDLPSYADVAKPVRRQLGIPAASKLVLYPVRGIRRKNLGELLLHSCISTEDTWHALTLAPRNPAELPSFERWKSLAEELGLRCLFDVCGRGEPAFLDTLAGSDWLVTTSVAEGFGMVFLEAWLAGKQLVGRDLPEITSEFKAAGLRFDCLRESLEVPLAWLTDRRRLAEALRRAYAGACDSYGIDADDEQMNRAAQMAGDDNTTIDFALLPSKFQEQVIRHAAGDPATAREELDALNPDITSPRCDDAASAQQIAANAATVRSTYSLPIIGRRIRDIYQALKESPLGDRQPLSSGEEILRTFLQIDRLHTIRFEE